MGTSWFQRMHRLPLDPVVCSGYLGFACIGLDDLLGRTAHLVCLVPYGGDVLSSAPWSTVVPGGLSNLSMLRCAHSV